MTKATVSTPTSLDERERQMRADYEWALHDAAVQGQFAGQVVAVSRRRVWGSGRTHRDALNDAVAQPGCPPRDAIALVPVEGRGGGSSSAANGSPPNPTP